MSEVKIVGLFEPTKKQLGELSQVHIIARLLEVGYAVLAPYGDSSRYDLVIEAYSSQSSNRGYDASASCTIEEQSGKRCKVSERV